jgi:hypothetical protein
MPFSRVEHAFPNAARPLEHGNEVGLEGAVSMRRSSHYESGPSGNGVQAKCRGWQRVTAQRYRIIQGPRKLELTRTPKMLAKRREELVHGICVFSYHGAVWTDRLSTAWSRPWLSCQDSSDCHRNGRANP